MRKLSLFAIIAILTWLAACKSGEQPRTEESGQPAAAQKEEPPQTQKHTAREAFQRLYVAARGWAPDARPFRLTSQPTSDANGQDGRAAVWRAGFASASRRSIKSFLWSGTRAEGAPEPGLTPGTEDTYNPANRATAVFDIAFLKVDSDKAVAVAQKHGGEKILKQNPDQPITYLLDWNSGENVLVWHVLYGTGQMDAKLRVAVNATTGAFIKIEK